jgi:serine/threonine-protein kinase
MYQLRFDLSEDRLVLAKRAADRALGLDPELPEAHMALGLYYYWGRADFARALEEFETARDLRPSDAEAFLLIGHIARRQGRWPEAIDSYRKSAELDPRFPRAWYNLGETQLFTREYGAARENLAKARALAPDFMETYTQLARVAINERGDVVEARELLRQAQERIPRDSWRGAMLEFARVLYNPDLDDFLDELRPGANGVDSASYYAAKASMVSQTRGAAAAAPQYDSARALLTRMAIDQPDQPWIHAQLGMALAGLGQADDAVRSARRALELLPPEVDALQGPEFVVYLATVYVMLGDIVNGVACFDRALGMPSWVSTSSLAADPRLEALRDTPQFRELLAKWSPLGGASLTTSVESTSCR